MQAADPHTTLLFLYTLVATTRSNRHTPFFLHSHPAPVPTPLAEGLGLGLAFRLKPKVRGWRFFPTARSRCECRCILANLLGNFMRNSLIIFTRLPCVVLGTQRPRKLRTYALRLLRSDTFRNVCTRRYRADYQLPSFMIRPLALDPNSTVLFGTV